MNSIHLWPEHIRQQQFSIPFLQPRAWYSYMLENSLMHSGAWEVCSQWISMWSFWGTNMGPGSHGKSNFCSWISSLTSSLLGQRWGWKTAAVLGRSNGDFIRPVYNWALSDGAGCVQCSGATWWWLGSLFSLILVAIVINHLQFHLFRYINNYQCLQLLFFNPRQPLDLKGCLKIWETPEIPWFINLS